MPPALDDVDPDGSLRDAIERAADHVGALALPDAVDAFATADEVCSAVALARTATTMAEAAINAVESACTQYADGGKSRLQTLRKVADEAFRQHVLKELTYFVIRRGLEPHATPGSWTPRAPVPFPPALEPTAEELADDLVRQNPTLYPEESDRPTARKVARQCVWLVSARGASPPTMCATLPIYASGNEWPDVTNHDLDALATFGGWTFLNYEGPGKPRQTGWPRNACNPAPLLTEHCDEYPFHATLQGGPPSSGPKPHPPSLRPMDATQNQNQGGNYGAFAQRCLKRINLAPFLGIPMPPELGVPTQHVCNL